MHRLGLLAFCVAMVAGSAGCGRPFAAATPPGFVELKDRYGKSEYRATTADGVVIGVRSFDNDPKGDLAFWTRAIENKMRELGGYALLETRPVSARSGLKGSQLRFGHDEGTEPHLYYMTIFTDDKNVFLLEAGGTKAQMQRFDGQIDWSVKNFQPR